MRAALYARYSSENQREASIEDQYRNCERFAGREGWQIVARYEDKGISGTKGETGRGGYKALLEAAKAKRFDVLLVDDFSRLSRDQVETETVRRRLVHWGIRLIGVSDGIDTAAKGHKMLSSFKGIMNEVYLDDLREKTHRGLAGQALKGNNCGGRAYGYRHVPQTHPTDKDEYGRPRIMAVRREIDEEQARWVRRIFQWYAQGRSPRDIADELNQRGIPGPGAFYRRRRPSRRYGTWCATALHGDLQCATGILSNPLYIGRVIWNRREWLLNPETKRRVPKLRPESEWIITAQPELRIIPQALWDQVQQRRTAQAHGQIMTNGRARDGRGPKYLLSGLLKCDECASSFIMADTYRYGCGGRISRGASVCTNDRRVARTLVEARCLAALREELLTPEAVARIIQKTTRLLAQRNRARQPERERLQRELVKVDGEIANIVSAIKKGCLTVTTKSELEKAETERGRLHEALETRATTTEKVATLLPRATERYRAVVQNLGSLSASHIAQAREQIRELVGEIRLVPTADGYLEAILTGRYDGLMKLAVGANGNNLVAGEGFEPSTFGL